MERYPSSARCLIYLHYLYPLFYPLSVENMAVQESSPFKTLVELYKSLDELTQWPEIADLRESAEYAFMGSEISNQKLRLEKVNREEQPRTLVCHDMKGGYLEDRFINGSKSHDSYAFYHWSVIDTFVYFSHHFITLPPYGWINVAHTHGVKVLGTVITERSGIWETILETRETAKKFANALIHLAKFYKFEGWLLNVENKIEIDHLDNLIYFVHYLTVSIHEEIENSEIIWYDSVTNTGELKWQNELNDQNKEFFLNCDGIYLNYTWTESRLASSYILAKDCGRDPHDVYVGLDVWGRGCPGGGGFNSAYALEKIRQQKLSVAIFAPGWTHEYFGPETFHKLEDIFWAQLFPYLYVHVPIYENEAFRTSFCRGKGASVFHYGEAQFEMEVAQGKSTFKEKPFFNLTLQKPQISVVTPHLEFTHMILPPTLVDKQKPSTEHEECIYETKQNIIRICKDVVNFEPKTIVSNFNCFEYYDRFSYEGGGCLKLVTKDSTVYHRLFLIHVDCRHDIQASIVYEDDGVNLERDELRHEPTLIAGNGVGLKSIIPFTSERLNSRWKKCVYLTNMKTINEIGISFAREGTSYIGEIALEAKQRQFDRCSADQQITDYVIC
ncbi:hypothetical protein KM043_017144 [Ampulex compressa]|nr:hypothetical protein KM043_017144 [Ampulex compressa]